MKKSLFLTLICLFAVLSAFVAPGGETARAAEKNNQNHTLGAEEITLVDSYTNLNTKLSASTSETYLPSDRKWNGIATSVSYGDNLFVAWYTGGTKEPHPDNYIPVAASSDGGKTWKDPFMIIDPTNSTSVVLPVFFVNGAGDLLLYYSILPGSKMYAVKLIGADGPLSGITYEGPFKVSDRTGFVKQIGRASCRERV